MNRGSCRLDNNCAGAGRGVALSVGSNVVDGVGGDLRRVDEDVADERAIQKCFVAEVMALVVVHDCAELGVGVADVDRCGIAALDVDGWGSGRSRNRWWGWRAGRATLHLSN